MRNYLLRLITSSFIVVLCFASTSLAQGFGIEVPPVPENLVVPEGNQVFFKGSAVGTQNYICMPAGKKVAWKFLGPQATLFVAFKGELSQQVSTHFLSANPAENGMARPSWQHSTDSSRVWAEAIQSSLDPAFVEPGAVSWLLLRIVGAQLGPTNGSFLADTTFIQRLNTSGGVAPSTGCDLGSDVGRVVLVPYTTDYFFYKAERE